MDYTTKKTGKTVGKQNDGMGALKRTIPSNDFYEKFI